MVGAYNESKAALMKQDKPRFVCARGGTSESDAVVDGVRLAGGESVVLLETVVTPVSKPLSTRHMRKICFGAAIMWSTTLSFSTTI